MHEKLKFEQIKKDSCASLRYDYSSLYPKDEMPLHFHPEIEICYVVKGSGYRMIGDFLEPFEEGEVVLVPTNNHIVGCITPKVASLMENGDA